MRPGSMPGSRGRALSSEGCSGAQALTVAGHWRPLRLDSGSEQLRPGSMPGCSPLSSGREQMWQGAAGALETDNAPDALQCKEQQGADEAGIHAGVLSALQWQGAAPGAGGRYCPGSDRP